MNSVFDQTLLNAFKKVENEIPVISVEDVNQLLLDPKYKSSMKLIDVRRADEFVGELGHIKGSVLSILGPELISFLECENKNQHLIFICRSGARSAQATQYSLQIGFTSVINMSGGMLRWNELKFPILK